MLGLLIRKNVLLHLTSFRFFAPLVIAFVLVTVSTLASISEYQYRADTCRLEMVNAAGEAQQADTYSRLTGRYLLEPNPYEFLSRGVGDQYGNSIAFNGVYGSPRLSVFTSYKNAFVAAHAKFDFAGIVGIFITLLAIFLTYDAVIGESERGQMKQVLSNPVPRVTVLAGQYLGALVTVTCALVLCVLLLLVIVLVSFSDVPPQLFSRIGVVLAASILLGSVYIWVGLLVSSLSRSSAASLTMSVLIWFLSALLFSNVAGLAARTIRPTDLQLMMSGPECTTAEKHSPSAYRAAGISTGYRWARIYDNAPPAAGGTDPLNLSTYNRMMDQYDLYEMLSWLSPAGVFRLIAGREAKSGPQVHARYVHNGLTLQNDYIAWQREKLNRLPSRGWMVTDSDGPLDRSGFTPVQAFSPLRDTPDDGVGQAMTLTLALVLWNVLLCGATGIAFLRRVEERM
jgi:ABC-type transport system involved in multi-copper enzyme maturation permease subunit